VQVKLLFLSDLHSTGRGQGSAGRGDYFLPIALAERTA
jgi:hypothetical protein